MNNIILKPLLNPFCIYSAFLPTAAGTRGISTSLPLLKKRAGRFRVTIKSNKPLTYEEFNKPHHIAHRKAWNSLNTSAFPEWGEDGKLQNNARTKDITVSDLFIRKFMAGTWHNLFVSEIIIKRQHNLIRIAGIVQRSIAARKMYFLIGYTEELLSYWTQCPVKLELQTVQDKEAVVFKYV